MQYYCLYNINNNDDNNNNNNNNNTKERYVSLYTKIKMCIWYRWMFTMYNTNVRL